MFTIRIDLEDRDLETRFGRRLAELTGSLEIILGKKKEDCAGDLVIDTENFREFIPVYRGLSIIADKYIAKTGKPLYQPKNGFRKHYLFTSPTGGSGLSSIALVFSRLLSARTGEKVLLIDIGRPGSFIYAEMDREPQKTIRELEYRAETDQDILLADHLIRDHYGIDILSLQSLGSKLLGILETKGGYDTVVIAGETEAAEAGGMEISIINMRDSRMCDHPDSGHITVRNRDHINNIKEDRVLIAEDGLSFKNPSGTVVISMDGDLAYGVDKLMRRAVNEYEYI